MIAASRIRDNQRFLLVAAASILLVLCSRSACCPRGSAAPPAAEIPGRTASPIPADPTIRPCWWPAAT